MASFDIDCESYFVEDLQFHDNFFLDKLLILNVNCQSLRNKFNLFEQFLCCCSIHFDIICVTET